MIKNAGVSDSCLLSWELTLTKCIVQKTCSVSHGTQPTTIFSGARALGKTDPPKDFSTPKFSQNAPLLASPAKKCVCLAWRVYV